MTTLQKALFTATSAVLAAVAIYQSFEVSQLRKLNQTLDEQRTQLPDRFRQMQRERDDANESARGGKNGKPSIKIQPGRTAQVAR